jgi:purine-binding chemotaxis protein CheW
VSGPTKSDPHRLAAVLTALDAMDDRLGDASDRRAEEILKRRAWAAAARREDLEEPERRMVAFRVADQLYGLPLELVVAVAFLRTMVPLPGVPSALVGLIGVRGRHVTAIDLALFLEGRGAAPSADRRHIADASKAILVQQGAREVALLCEELVGIRELYRGDLRALQGAAPNAVVKQIGPEGMQAIDVPALFADERLSAAEQARRKP